MIENKQFILGVGTQKSGTTWLWNYLNSRSDVDMGFMKEYHIFDALTVPDFIGFKHQVERNAYKCMNDGIGLAKLKQRNSLKRLAFMTDLNLYYDYFCARLFSNDIKVTGDLTPAYCALSVNTLQHIKANFQEKGIKVKPIFLIRDPVDRLYSQTKMQFRNFNIEPTIDEIIEIMHANITSKVTILRSNYELTISSLVKVFGDDFFLAFYETLFTPETIKDLCTFLEIEFVSADYKTKQNFSKVNFELPTQVRNELMVEYKSTYYFVGNYIGQDKLKQIWKHYSP